jgi:Holliday junction resolvasome RuvABC ATP-dependent DNA helicase subunit
MPDVDNHFIIPPLILFIDEVHALPPQTVQSLLKAIEPKDGRLATEEGWSADCRKICWIVATTDRGLLFDAFDTRFRKIQLNLYGREEIAEIVKLNNPDWSIEVCRIVAQYCWRVPREALAFAQDMRTEYELQSRRGRVSWEQVAAAVARDSDIDPMGMTLQRVKALVALGQQGAIPRGRLCHYTQCKEEELIKFVMPPLITATANEPALVAVTSKGYSITRAGLKELERRGIPHQGDKAMILDIPPLDWGDYDPIDMGYGQQAKPQAEPQAGFWLPPFMRKRT